jgi:hypothetical protein
MVRAALKVLVESGALAAPSSAHRLLVQKMLEAAFSAFHAANQKFKPVSERIELIARVNNIP